MDFFFRRRPCLLLEEQQTLENTKKLFLNKINFLQKQYKFCFESLQKNSNIAPEFIKAALFSFDLGSKVLDCISHLISSSELEWKFLNFFAHNPDDAYILGKFKKSYCILSTEEIYNSSDSFFFDLLAMKIIDIPTWKNLCRLQQFAYSFGISNPNDYSYYSCKGVDTVHPNIFPLANLKEIEAKFYKFLGKPIVFRPCTPMSWRLLMMVMEMKNESEIVSYLKKNNYKYDLIRKNKSDLDLPSDGFNVLFECLSSINSLSDLHFITREVELAGKNAPRELLRHLIFFFLSKSDFLFASKDLECRGLSKDEKFFRAIEMLKFIEFLCDSNVSITKDFDQRMEKNFSDQCEMYLEPFKESRKVSKAFALDFFIFATSINLVIRLNKNSFYKKHYSKYIDPHIGALN